MKKTRNGNIDILKFVGALAIMSSHMYHIGIEQGTYPFDVADPIVTFFFIVTGYFTMCHFAKENNDNPMKASIIYTIKKFLPFVPYVILANVIGWISQQWITVTFNGTTAEDIFVSMGDFVYDLFLLSSSYTFPLVSPLWFLSSMFLAFPLFAWICQLKNRYWILLISFIYPLTLFGFIGVNGQYRTWYGDVLKALATMLIGAFVYQLITIFNGLFKSINGFVLASVEIICLVVFVVSGWKNIEAYRLMFVCTVIGLLICFSGCAKFPKMNFGICSYLGKLSMPLYMMHWPIGTVLAILTCFNPYVMIYMIPIYFVSTIAVSVLLMFLIDHWKWFQALCKKPMVLID